MEKTIEREGLAILSTLDRARVPYQSARISPTEACVTVCRTIPHGEKGKAVRQGWIRSIRELLAMRRVLVTPAEDDRPGFARRGTGPQARVVIALRPAETAE